MKPTAPNESRHALDLETLQTPTVRLWTAHIDDEIVGTVALVEIDLKHAELKAMRTAPRCRRQGIAAKLLEHALVDASSRGLSRVSLETGAASFFAAAHALYRKAGFQDSGPFGRYSEDPHSVFMTRTL
ncbi:GNAT family N-acetyltransferase [Leucobacter massiliensis]|uniref:GNAT family N-acetyltransferase n=2 Tax=Leucobacter massiliensis TaxID=1686285 RepID=A0A2S9QLN3_9MICO|nr:GNAT family N-acetyltransferase [Leucobacter massiliensis]